MKRPDSILLGAVAAARGLRVPGDVSLVCTDADPILAWSEPSVTHICWDPEPVVRRIVR